MIGPWQLRHEDRAPDCPELTAYDERHRVTYLRLLDAEDEGRTGGWSCGSFFGLNSEHDPGAARLAHKSHLARARSNSETGYREFSPTDHGKIIETWETPIYTVMIATCRASPLPNSRTSNHSAPRIFSNSRTGGRFRRITCHLYWIGGRRPPPMSCISLERPGFAWEFLRRSHAYRRAYKSISRQQKSGNPDEIAADAKLARWGLSFRVRSSATGGPSKGRMAAGIHSDGGPPGARSNEISQSD